MPFLELEDSSATRKFEHDSGEWFEVRDVVDKKTLNRLFNAIPDSLLIADNKFKGSNAGFAIKQAPELAEKVFPILAVAWSMKKPCTLENYLSLKPIPAGWIDACLLEQVQKIVFAEQDDEAGKATKSPSSSLKGTTSKNA